MERKQKSFYCYILKLNPVLYSKADWTKKEISLVGIHFEYLSNLADRGILFLAGRTVNEPMSARDFGIAILETDTEEEARDFMNNDPAVKGGLMKTELFNFSLALLRNKTDV